MFYQQQNYYSECHEVTYESFWQILRDKEVDRLCNNAKIMFEQAQGYGLESEQGKEWYEKLRQEKQKLPCFLYMAGLIEASVNKKGVRGIWRKASSCLLNGLCMIDVDHLDDARKTFEVLTKKINGFIEQPLLEETQEYYFNQGWFSKLGVMLIHITPSGHGLRFVFKGDTEIGNIAANQAHFAKQLGVEIDESCKDASRMSYAFPESNLLFLNEQIFNYNDKTFEEKWGASSRNGKSQPQCSGGTAAHSEKHGEIHDQSDNRITPDSADDGHIASCQRTVENSRSDRCDIQQHGSAPRLEMGQTDGKEPGSTNLLKDNDGKECYKYRNVLIPYSEIVQKLVEKRGGEPSVGGRNNMLYDLVRLDLRHICDNNEDFVFRVAPSFGLSEQERKETIHSALSSTRYGMSRTLRNVLEDSVLGRTTSAAKDDCDGVRKVQFNHSEIWNTFKPYLGGVWAPVVNGLDDNIKFAGFLAAGAMFGTYLSAVTLKNFYDKKDWRLSFMVYIIGQAASGKGNFQELNQLIMTPLRQRDEEGRRWEEKYKEDREKRSNSSSNQKAKAMEIEHFPIRVLPGTISNAMRYKRMRDSKRVINGEEIHLHCYIFESELSAKLRSEQGSWAGAQDLDCKSFSNEYGGNDYGNSQAVNGLIEVNMNQVITGTHDAMNRKITARNCMDGLATRLIMFEMPDSSFQMLNIDNMKRTVEQTEWLSTIGDQLNDCAGIVDLDANVRVPKSRQSDFGTTTSISKALYQWGVDEAERCRASNDICADYFRRRAPIIAARYAAVDAIMNDLAGFKNKGKVKITFRQVELALLLCSYIQESQMYFFGGKIMQGLADEAAGLAPQAKVQKKTTDLYASLDDQFTLTQVQSFIPNYSSATSRVRRWLNDGVISIVKGKGRRAVYKKLKKVL